MKILTETITLEELKKMAANLGGDMVKAVVDIDRELIAIDADLHSDLEAFLLDDGSKQKSLWGINLYPEISGEEFVEFDSMINVRPSHGNGSRGVTDEGIRKKVVEIVIKKVSR